jgi:3-methyl-2-oxobutanoate hydroxymethyltransferase
MLGLFTDFVPSHAKQYVRLAEIIKEAFSQYANEVKEGSFPTNRESFTMDESLLDELASLP